MTEVVSLEFPEPDFPFIYMPVSSQTFAYPPHTHTFIELVIILGGNGVHILDDVPSPLNAGNVYVVTAQTTHAYVECSGLRLVNLLFRPELLSSFEAELRSLPGYHALFALEPHYRQQHRGQSMLHLAPQHFVQVEKLLDRLDVEWTVRAAGYHAMLLTTLVQLIVFLARRFSDSETHSARVLWQIGEVISLMEQSYAEPLTLERLAETAAMSPRNLIRRFRDGTGLSPIAYLIHLRIRRAAELLRSTDMSIGEIAGAVGMSDSSYFSRQFKAALGVSPRAFRDTRDLET
ncbi:MAG: helix-turn-helix domain-containing protein [Armatimonadota bacterium]